MKLTLINRDRTTVTLDVKAMHSDSATSPAIWVVLADDGSRALLEPEPEFHHGWRFSKVPGVTFEAFKVS